jgi:hypothetical protein
MKIGQSQLSGRTQPCIRDYQLTLSKADTRDQPIVASSQSQNASALGGGAANLKCES